jgi:hypothetical protein
MTGINQDKFAVSLLAAEFDCPAIGSPDGIVEVGTQVGTSDVGSADGM